MPVEIGPEWQEHIAALRDFRGTAMLLGAPDTGKTSLAVALVGAWAEAGARAAVMDLDLGQSEIGPPGTIGMAYAEKAFTGIGSLVRPAIEFVGATSPARNQAGALAAASLLHARREPRDVTLIDSCGYVFGPGARMYKLQLVRLLRPDAVVALQKGSEIEPLVHLLESVEGLAVRRVPASSFAVRRTPEMRSRRREVKWARYFREAEVHTLPLEDVEIAGSWWRSGEALPSPEMKTLASILGGPALAAERMQDALTIIPSGTPPKDIAPHLQERFRVEHIYVLHPSRFRNVLCAVGDPHWRTIAAGILRGVDFARGELSVLAPVRSTHSIRTLMIGQHRVRPDGKDLGPLRGWEV
jgi:polynucleotide 5'-hydroxyl-kinase GRC3/NOL9